MVSDGEVTDVPPGQLDALGLSNGRDSAAPALDLATWADDPVVEERNGDTVVTGELDAVELLEDLQRIAAEVAGSPVPDEIDDDEADRLRSLVTASDVEVVTTGDDHRLRSLEASVDFGADVPPELEEAFGAYAGARLEVAMTIDELAGELEVEHP